MTREEKDTELLTLIKESRGILGELTRATKRSNEIKKAADEHSRDMIPMRFDKVSYIMGAKWADENPQSPWINAKGDLPYNHEELISTQDKATKKVIVMDKYDGAMVDFMKKAKSGVWYWGRSVNVLYWMPIPEFPKE